MLPHSGDDILKKYLAGEGVAMVNYGLRVWPIPAVNLQAATAFPQSTVPDRSTHVYRLYLIQDCFLTVEQKKLSLKRLGQIITLLRIYFFHATLTHSYIRLFLQTFSINACLEVICVLNGAWRMQNS